MASRWFLVGRRAGAACMDEPTPPPHTDTPIGQLRACHGGMGRGMLRRGGQAGQYNVRHDCAGWRFPS